MNIDNGTADTFKQAEENQPAKIERILEVPIYNWIILLVGGFDAKELTGILKDNGIEKYAIDEIVNNAKMCDPFTVALHYEISDQHSSVIWLPKPLTLRSIPAIAHECLHAANCILGNKGLRLTRESEEAYCYLHTFIFEQTLNLLNLV